MTLGVLLINYKVPYISHPFLWCKGCLELYLDSSRALGCDFAVNYINLVLWFL